VFRRPVAIHFVRGIDGLPSGEGKDAQAMWMFNWLANDAVQRAADERASYAMKQHSDDPIGYLTTKLRCAGRSRVSRREIRIAIDTVRKKVTSR
jgi:hypothetical protein